MSKGIGILDRIRVYHAGIMEDVWTFLITNCVLRAIRLDST